MNRFKNLSKKNSRRPICGDNRPVYRLDEMELGEIRHLAMLATKIGTSKTVTKEQTEALEYLSSSVIVLARRSLKHLAEREHFMFTGCEPLPDRPVDGPLEDL